VRPVSLTGKEHCLIIGMEVLKVQKSTTVALETLGCKLNQAESEALAEQFAGVGCRLVPAAEGRTSMS